MTYPPPLALQIVNQRQEKRGKRGEGRRMADTRERERERKLGDRGDPTWSGLSGLREDGHKATS